MSKTLGLAKTEDDRTFLASSLLAFFVAVQWGLATGFLPLVVRQLGGSYVDVALVFTLFASFRVICSPFWGYLSDLTGRRKIFAGVGALAIGPIFLAVALSSKAHEIIVLRASTGILMSAIYPITAALVTEISNEQYVGRNVGIYATFQSSGFALGYLIGGFLTESFGFQLIWILCALVSVLGGVIFLVTSSDPRRSNGRRREQKPKFVFPKRPNLYGVFAPSLATTLFVMGHSTLGPNFQVFFVEELKASTSSVGLLLFSGILAQLAFQPIAGKYADKVEKKKLLIMAGGLMPVPLVSLLLYQDLTVAFLGLILMGIAEAFFMVSCTAYIADITRGEVRGRSMGIWNSFEAIGRAAGPVIGGLVAQAYSLRMTLIPATLFPLASLAVIMISLRTGKGLGGLKEEKAGGLEPTH